MSKSICESVKNYILLGNRIEDLRIRAREIAHESKEKSPSSFNTDEPYFEYDMRYAPPFEKNFDMLFNIQGVAAEKAKFRDEYRGFIIFDVSAYLRHENEEWFDISLKYFHDRNDVWKYIFLVDCTNSRAGEEMTGKILSLLYCRVEDRRGNDANEIRNFIKRECMDNAVNLSKAASLFLEDYLSGKEGERSVVSTFLSELAEKYKNTKRIDMQMISSHIESGDSVIKYMLSDEKYAKFLALTELYVKKGTKYDEKI